MTTPRPGWSPGPGSRSPLAGTRPARSLTRPCSRRSWPTGYRRRGRVVRIRILHRLGPSPWHRPRNRHRSRPGRARRSTTRWQAGLPASAGRGCWTAAHARLRQLQLHPARGLLVAGEVGGDRADLLVAGGQKEGRRTAVALHANQEQARLGLGELGGAVRAHGPARVLVGVDQRRQRPRALQRRVEVEAQLGQEGEIGPQPGRHHQLVGLDRQALTLGLSGDQERIIRSATDLVRREG